MKRSSVVFLTPCTQFKRNIYTLNTAFKRHEMRNNMQTKTSIINNNNSKIVNDKTVSFSN